LIASLLVLALSCQFAAAAAGDLPDAATVIQQVMRRSDDEAQSGEARKYTYEKHCLAAELDRNGNATKTTDETYEVFPIQGISFSRLVKIQNRQLTSAETEEQNRKEQQFRQKLAGKNENRIAEKDHDTLNSDLVGRYDFHVERRERLENRTMLVLSFHPKANRGLEKTVEDRVLNRFEGSVWVDEEDAEVAQVQVRLTEDLRLGWFGMIGSIKQCDLRIERQRLSSGVWVNKSQTVLLDGRKVFTPMRYRTLEESFNFRKP